MNYVKIKSFKSVLETGIVLVELDIAVPTGVVNIVIPVSDDLLRVCAEARGEIVWSELDIVTIVSQFLNQLSQNVTWSV